MCVECREFEKNTLPDKRVIKTVNDSFYPMMVKDTETEFHRLTRYFQINSLPALIIAPKDGKSKKGLIIQGNIPTVTLLDTLKKVISNSCSSA